jgi:DNA-binding LacI/PurR family transcriptional regulator
MEEEARAAGYSILVTFTNYDVNREEGAIRSLTERGVAGLVLTVADANASSSLAFLDRQKTPYTLVYNQVTVLSRPTVSVDNAKASRDLVDMFVDHGHRRIGMVVGSLYASDRSARRLEGYRSAVRNRGLASGPIVEIPFENIDTAELASRLTEAIDDSPRPTAFFCSNDLLALVVIRGLRDLGYSVPEDFSVGGFDGISLGRLMDPPLAGVIQPNRQLGRSAVRHLIDHISGQAVPANIVLDHELRAGGTLARIIH